MNLQPEKLLEIGKLYCDRGDYTMAMPNLQAAAEKFLEQKDFELYLKTLQPTLRIHAEKLEFDEINLIKEKIHELAITEGIALTSRMYYTLGACATLKSQPDSGVQYLKKALEMALKNNNHEDMCYAILLLSICYRMQKKYDEALKEVYNLNIFLQELDSPELKIGSYSSNARILMDLKKYEQALDVLWLAYDEIKNTKQLTTVVVILENIGECLFELGQRDAAKIYFNLAVKSIEKENNKLLLARVEKYLAAMNNSGGDSSDLIFDLDNHAIVEKSLGKVDFKNQFILLDLLKLFMSHQGQIFSKEYLVENVWKQNYEPEIHDNKIYVTIKRLRKMIEPDYDKPKYIFRAKNGYYLSKAAKVEVNLLRAEGSI